MDESKVYIASLSYGKDSMAMLHVIIDVLHWPLDRVITADVWATDTIPADLPPMWEFKKKADKRIYDRWGIEVEHFCAMKSGKKLPYEEQFYTKVGEKRLTARKHGFYELKKCHNNEGMIDIYGFPLTLGAWCNSCLKIKALDNAGKKTYEDMFYHVRQRGNREGQIVGFPQVGRPECNSALKRPVFERISRETVGAVNYVGIASDEGKRTERHIEKVKAGNELLPLVEAGWTEQMCRDWCEENDLLSPVYTTSTRDGCWFCHNQGVAQLRNLRKNYPDLWALLLKWDLDSPVTFKADGHTVHDYDRRFQWEDEGYLPQQKQFRWEDVEYPQMNIFQFIREEEETDETGIED